MIGTEHGHMVAFERLLSMLGEDALDRFMRGNVTAGKARIFPGFPRVTASAVHLFQ
jgi:hypothetical protein